MKNKRGQITIFIIVAIVLVVGLLTYFLFRGNITTDFEKVEVENVKTFVVDCIEKVGEEIIFDVSRGGGYYLGTELSTDSGIPIYYSGVESYVPSREEVEGEISFWVAEKLFFCTRNFVDFNELNVSQGEIFVETTILEERVVLDVDYPIGIGKGRASSSLRFFDVDFPFRIGVLNDASREFVSTQEVSEGFCLSCLLDISLRDDFYVSVFDYDNETMAFIFEDRTVEGDEGYLKYVFANRYLEVEDEE